VFGLLQLLLPSLVLLPVHVSVLLLMPAAGGRGARMVVVVEAEVQS